MAKEFSLGSTKAVAAHSWWMEVKVTVNDDGSLSAFIHTSSREAMMGFTGTAVLILRDAARNIIDVDRTAAYGVNGEWIPGAPSERRDVWTHHLSRPVVDCLDSMEIEVMEAGKSADDRLRDIVGQIVDTARWVKQKVGAQN
jgi:hypothetical protein